MDLEEIRKHWEEKAREHGIDLKATTKTSTLKKIEVDALFRAIKAIPFVAQNDVKILEVG